MQPVTNRRNVLRLVAGLPLLGLAGPAFAARPALIERLMTQAQPLPRVSERIDFISGKLVGIRYQANTLVGSPRRAREIRRPRRRVRLRHLLRGGAGRCHRARLGRVRDRCCAASATSTARCSTTQRNHYFADWCQRNIENGICRPVAIEPSVTYDKTLDLAPGVPPRRGFRSLAVSKIDDDGQREAARRRAILSASRPGGAGLDYYHTGFVAFGRNGELLLRNASQKPRPRARRRRWRRSPPSIRCSMSPCCARRRPRRSRSAVEEAQGQSARPKAASPQTKPVTVSVLIRSVAAHLKRAKLVFAHGTTDPAVEAAFIVGETLGIHPDYVRRAPQSR